MTLDALNPINVPKTQNQTGIHTAYFMRNGFQSSTIRCQLTPDRYLTPPPPTQEKLGGIQHQATVGNRF